jgi:hypothetical protein
MVREKNGMDNMAFQGKRRNMKKLFAMSIVAAVLGIGPLMAQEYTGPRIEAKELRHDFGKVVQGTQVSHVFEIKSVGKEALVIEKVQSS